jgi:hypothetical protein
LIALPAERRSRGLLLPQQRPCAVAYARLITRGKPPKLALVALMRKMLITRNAIARAHQPWSEPALQPAA